MSQAVESEKVVMVGGPRHGERLASNHQWIHWQGDGVEYVYRRSVMYIKDEDGMFCRVYDYVETIPAVDEPDDIT